MNALLYSYINGPLFIVTIMNRELINTLIDKYRNGSASEAEKQTLMRWYRQAGEEESVFPGDEHEVENQMLKRLQLDIKGRDRQINWRRWYVAASLVAVFSAGILLFKNQAFKHPEQTAEHGKMIIPGGNKAILTLANGTKISLTDAQQGDVANQSGIRVTKTGEGELLYVVGNRKQTVGEAIIEYNTIETPRGGQYQLRLPDGTAIWLNSVSSIRFPVNFTSLKERRIELKGEAYFEVAADKMRPFRVIAGTQEIEVLGTDFNISAFPDEPVSRTTLLSGAVKVLSGGSSALLKPGQQAEARGGIEIKTVDPSEVVAWKNGYFRFDDERLESIMRKISRWYNVDVSFADESLKNEQFATAARRSTGISELLRSMEQTGNVKFDIKGSFITVRHKNK